MRGRVRIIKYAVIAVLLGGLYDLLVMGAPASNSGTVAGFGSGIWHGFILLVTFVISLFDPDVGIYAVHNNGGWYNFGFVFGAWISLGISFYVLALFIKVWSNDDDDEDEEKEEEEKAKEKEREKAARHASRLPD